MKLSASKFNEKNVFRQFKKKKISQMSPVRTGVRAYMDATPLGYGITVVGGGGTCFVCTVCLNIPRVYPGVWYTLGMVYPGV